MSVIVKYGQIGKSEDLGTNGGICLSVFMKAKSEKNFSFGVTHYLRLRQAFFHKVECLLPLGQAQRLNSSQGVRYFLLQDSKILILIFEIL